MGTAVVLRIGPTWVQLWYCGLHKSPAAPCMVLERFQKLDGFVSYENSATKNRQINQIFFRIFSSEGIYLFVTGYNNVLCCQALPCLMKP